MSVYTDIHRVAVEWLSRYSNVNACWTADKELYSCNILTTYLSPGRMQK